MRTISTQNISRQEVLALLKKPAFDEVALGPGAAAKTKKVFGREITAAEAVNLIVAAVRREGDAAVLQYSQAIDGVLLDARSMEVSAAEFTAAYQQADEKIIEDIRQAVENVRRFHTEQLPKSWLTYRSHGAMLGQNCIPLERVGVYVPGGTAAYPSSVIMNAVPAAVAGVTEIIMAVPPSRDGQVNPYVLIAAKESGVSRIFKMGGAQAIAALAFGTETIPKVDKITGPGNIFVTLAKKAVYGYCDIDMLAGPSEILIIADAGADPRYVAADMLSQAEHDVLASSIVITDSSELAAAVGREVKEQLNKLSRKEIAAAALDRNGLIIIAGDLQEAIELANISAPEHLEVLTADPFRWVPFIKNAGAIFLGPFSPEPLGDYFAGPNHVLPTGGTARFYSVLNVETFMKRTSLIAYTAQALQAVSGSVIRLAEAEGLQAHAEAIRVRGEKGNVEN